MLHVVRKDCMRKIHPQACYPLGAPQSPKKHHEQLKGAHQSQRLCLPASRTAGPSWCSMCRHVPPRSTPCRPAEQKLASLAGVLRQQQQRLQPSPHNRHVQARGGANMAAVAGGRLTCGLSSS